MIDVFYVDEMTPERRRVALAKFFRVRDCDRFIEGLDEGRRAACSIRTESERVADQHQAHRDSLKK